MAVPPLRRGPSGWLSGRAAPRTLAVLVAAAAVLAPSTLGGPAAGGAVSSHATSAGRQTAAGTGRSKAPLVAVGGTAAVPAGATDLGQLPATTALRLEVVLRPRDPVALAAFVRSVSDPGSPDYGRYLARGSFSSRFGPAAGDTASLRAGLSSLGLHTGDTSGDGLLLTASATAGQVSAALHVSIERYRLATGRQAFANRQAPQLPRSLASGVTAVAGLSDLPPAVPLLARPTSTSSTAAPAASGASAAAAVTSPSTGGPTPCKAALTARRGGYTWNQLAAAYGFTSAYGAGHLGAGETVGLFELQPYRPTDVTAFERCYSLPVGASWGCGPQRAGRRGPGRRCRKR